jgi:hypothetical protein
MALQRNPIPEILDLIPFKEGVLDFVLVDKMRVIVQQCTGYIVNNHFVLSLLEHLAVNKVIFMQEFSWASATGNLILVKRNTYGI